MESSIAEFLSRKLACELLPTYVSFFLRCLSIEDRYKCASRLEVLVTHRTHNYTSCLKACGSKSRILAEGAIALSVTLSGGALFAS